MGTEPRMAPDGMESLFVLVPVPHLGPNVDWDRDGDASTCANSRKIRS